MTPSSKSGFIAKALLTAALVALGLGAQTAQAASLEDAMTLAYATNPSLEAARAKLRAVDEGVPQALSGWRPTVGATATTARSLSERSTRPGTVTNLTPRTLSLQVTQPIFSGGGSLAALDRAENLVLAERARLAAAEQNVLLAAANAYLNLIRDKAVLELNTNNEQVLERQLQATRDRFEVGEITRTDVSLAEARLARAVADRIQAEGTLKATRATYVNVIGVAPDDVTRPTQPFGLPTTVGDAIVQARDDNMDLLSARFDAAAAKDAIAASRGTLYPSVDLSGSASRSYDTAASNYMATDYQAKLTLSVPLYQGGEAYSRLRQAKQQAYSAQMVADQAVRDAEEQVFSTWENLASTQARIGAFETQVQAAETALEGVQREASVGSRTVLDVLDAEQELLDARVNLVRSQRDESIAALALLAATGRLTAKDLNLPVDFYDAQGHYRDVRGKWFGADK